MIVFGMILGACVGFALFVFRIALPRKMVSSYDRAVEAMFRLIVRAGLIGLFGLVAVVAYAILTAH